MDKVKHYVIRPHNNHYVLVNTTGGKEHHTHLKTVGTCRMLVGLVCKKIIPTSSYLRVSAMRVSRDEKYIDAIQRKIIKDRSKQAFHKVNNGLW